MTKKRFATMATCIALVGAVAVGGTLALLTAPSNDVTNTFAVGEGYPTPPVGESVLTLDEAPVTQLANGDYIATSGDRDKDGISYAELVDGTTLAKDPTFHLMAGSPKSWIVAEIGTVDEAFTGSKFTANGWYKVAGEGTELSPYTATPVTTGTPITKGLYIYGKTINGGVNTSALFEALKYDEQTTSTASGETVRTPVDLVIKGCAVQAVGADQSVNAVVDTVVKAAVDAMKAAE